MSDGRGMAQATFLLLVSLLASALSVIQFSIFVASSYPMTDGEHVVLPRRVSVMGLGRGLLRKRRKLPRFCARGCVCLDCVFPL